MDADSHENITVEISDEAVIKGNLVGDYADYNVTGGTFYNEVEEGYLAWGYQLVGDAAPYTVAYTGKVSELTLVDGEFTEFVNEQELTVGTLTYERTLPAAGNWYPLTSSPSPILTRSKKSATGSALYTQGPPAITMGSLSALSFA